MMIARCKIQKTQWNCRLNEMTQQQHTPLLTGFIYLSPEQKRIMQNYLANLQLPPFPKAIAAIFQLDQENDVAMLADATEPRAISASYDRVSGEIIINIISIDVNRLIVETSLI